MPGGRLAANREGERRGRQRCGAGIDRQCGTETGLNQERRAEPQAGVPRDPGKTADNRGIVHEEEGGEASNGFQAENPANFLGCPCRAAPEQARRDGCGFDPSEAESPALALIWIDCSRERERVDALPSLTSRPPDENNWRLQIGGAMRQTITRFARYLVVNWKKNFPFRQEIRLMTGFLPPCHTPSPSPASITPS